MGQNDSAKVLRYFFVGGSILSYKGDLSSSYEKFTSGIQLGIRFNKKKKLNGAIQLGLGKVVGQNYNYQYPDNNVGTPNTFFESNIISCNYDLVFNIIKKENINLYVSQGAGVMRFVSRDEFGSKLIDRLNTRNRNETYNNVTIFFPTSLGLIYHFPKNIHLGVAISWLRPSSDYVDNISNLSSSSTKDNIMAIRMSLFLPFTPPHIHLKHQSKPIKPVKNERSIIISE